MDEQVKFVFISHSNVPEDLEFCKRLYRFLTQENNICAWMDAPDMHSGDWRAQIYQRIVDASAYILVASENSLFSDEVKKEIINITNSGKPLVPIALDDAYVTQDKRKGSIGYELADGRFQAVIMKNYPTERAALEKLLSLLPEDITRMQNNPADFVCSDDNETLIRYTGKDSHVVIPSFVQTIGKEAFVCNDTLEKVVIPPSVRKIGIRAFYGCEHLSRVEGMEGVEDIDPSAFSQTSAVDGSNEFLILNGVLLGGGENADNLVLPDVRVIANSVFECCDAKTVILPDTLEVIGKRAFADSCYLSEVCIPKSVKKIEKGAFCDCIKLKKVVLKGKAPEGVGEAFDKNTAILED